MYLYLYEADIDSQIDCNNPNALILTDVRNGTPPYSFSSTTLSGSGQLQDIPNSNQLAINGAGTFRVIVTDANNCVKEQILTITSDTEAPIADITSSATLLTCSQTSIQLDARHPTHNTSNIEYQWKRDNVIFKEGANEGLIEVADAGLYSLTVINRINGCISSEKQIQINKNNDVPPG